MAAMAPQYPTLDLPATLLARGGAPTDGPRHSRVAFERAVALGADGVESAVWRSADGRAVLDGTGEVGGRFRRRPISAVPRDELPEHLLTLDELYDACGPATVVSLQLGTPEVADEVLSVAAAAGATGGLWLAHEDHELLGAIRERSDTVRLVNTVELAALPLGPERRCAELRAGGIDALGLPFPEWTAGLVALCHRFGRYAHGREAQQERMARSLWDMGIDAISGDHIERMLVVRD